MTDGRQLPNATWYANSLHKLIEIHVHLFCRYKEVSTLIFS